jgi:hypothetical protein
VPVALTQNGAADDKIGIDVTVSNRAPVIRGDALYSSPPRLRARRPSRSTPGDAGAD